ncbi:T9SS type A sorting domain-containing protein [candidate division KSB1 bacterium]|nr:T9SS type A sorting domain-containing protein [candidate division KSB1 bacterium]
METLAMDDHKSVTATFTPPRLFTLTSWIMGSGQVLFDPPGGQSVEGTMVKLSAVPETGWQFQRWEGALNSTANPDSVVMDEDKIFIARFIETTGVNQSNNIPLHYSLGQNYPNPFNPQTTIPFSIRKPGRTIITVYDILGQKVATLLDEYLAAGTYQNNFDASSLTSGIYFVELASGMFMALKKMVVMQ